MDDIQFTEFLKQYYTNHALLENRLTRVETIVASMVTREDLTGLKTDLATFRESVKQMQTIGDSMATKNDVAWLKSFFWKAAGAIISILIALAGLLLSHVYAKVP